ncbi:MAG: hypothetical protein NVSMB52_03930 [Chloroflexota bacterium]
MQSVLPSRDRLSRALDIIFREMGGMRLLRRRQNVLMSAHPSEIVTGMLGDGTILDVLCKHSVDGEPLHRDRGSRGGLGYEGKVYQQALQLFDFSAPRFYGINVDSETGEQTLAIEYLRGAWRVEKSPDPNALVLAARWIGEFHRIHEERLLSGVSPPFTVWGTDDYLSWVQNTQKFGRGLNARYPWLRTLCACTPQVVKTVMQRPTLIHGEYNPQNVLIRSESVYPVDWESATIAAGEFDLVSIAEGWPAPMVRDCEREYQRARWSGSVPEDFVHALEVARLLTQFRWLGAVPQWTVHEDADWRFDSLYQSARKLGLV